MLQRSLCIAALVVGVLSTAAAQQPGSALQITSPTNGTLVNPGQTLNVNVSVSQNVQMAQVGVFGSTPLGDVGPLTSAPYQFTMNIPLGLPVGRYQLTAVGLDTSNNLLSSAPVFICVEPEVPVVAFTVQPTRLRFQFVGQQLPLIVNGTLSDGRTVDVTQSSTTLYTSMDPLSVAVAGNGLVTAVGGSSTATDITVQRGSLSVNVPATVPTSLRGDLDGNGVVDSKDLNILTIALNTPATKPADARDLNGDGVINALDTRILVTICTRAACATH